MDLPPSDTDDEEVDAAALLETIEAVRAGLAAMQRACDTLAEAARQTARFANAQRKRYPIDRTARPMPPHLFAPEGEA